MPSALSPVLGRNMTLVSPSTGIAGGTLTSYPGAEGNGAL